MILKNSMCFCISRKGIEAINVEIHDLEEQVKAIDGESRNSEDDKIL